MDTYPPITITALLGQAVGDAFGAPFEFHQSAPVLAESSLRKQRYLDSREDVGSAIKRCRLPGLYTDDTQQALALLWTWRQLLLKGRDPTDARLFAPVFQKVLGRMAQSRVGPFGVHRGTGSNFRTAIQHGTPTDTAGMGAAMRIGPVATLWPEDNPEGLISWVQTVSEVTTTNRLSQEAAAMFALHVWNATHGCPFDEPLHLLYPKGQDRKMWGLLWRALDLLKWKGEKALLDFAVDSGLANKAMKCASNGFALTGIPWVIHHAMRTDTFEDALLAVCQASGDTDTVGAMVGCFKSVLLSEGGKHRIPDWFLDRLLGAGSQRDGHLIHPETWHPVGSEETLTKADRVYRNKLKADDAKKDQDPDEEEPPF